MAAIRQNRIGCLIEKAQKLQGSVKSKIDDISRAALWSEVM
jgi:hypothetical protein